MVYPSGSELGRCTGLASLRTRWGGTIVRMHGDENPNTCPPSTTWAFKRVKVSTPRRGQQQRVRSTSFEALPPHPPRSKLSVTVVYRGGPECWWEITARGKTVRRPGALALHDVLRDIYRMP